MLTLGYVHDELNHPVSNAKLYVKEANLTLHSDINGKFGIPLQVGSYTVIVDAPRYFKDVRLVMVNDANTPKVTVFTLKRNNTFWGVPRLAFVTLTGKNSFFYVGSLISINLF